MIQKLLVTIRNKKDQINRFGAAFFISYFLFIVVPYCFSWNSTIDGFFTSITSKLVYRLIGLIYFLVYAVLVGIANRSKIKWTWAFIMGILLSTFIVAWIVTPRYFVYSTIDRDQATTIISHYVGDMDLWISFFLFFAEALMFVLSISFLPVVGNRKTITQTFIAIAAFAATSCLISYIKDFSFYFTFITHGNPGTNGISSIFHHKNEFGIFVFMGCFSCGFLSCYLPHKQAIPFMIGLLQFFITSLAIKCLTAEIPCTFLFVAFAFYFLGWIKKKAKPLFITLVIGFSVIMASLCLCVFTPAIREKVSAFAGFYNTFMSFSDEIDSRTEVWNFIPSIMKGPALFLGKTDAIANEELLCYLSASTTLRVIDYHDAFISFLTSHGLTGLAVYLAIHVDVARHILTLHKRFPQFCIMLSILFLSAVFFSMPETYTLFINMSVAVLPINLLFLVFLPFLMKDGAPQEKEQVTDTVSPTPTPEVSQWKKDHFSFFPFLPWVCSLDARFGAFKKR